MLRESYFSEYVFIHLKVYSFPVEAALERISSQRESVPYRQGVNIRFHFLLEHFVIYINVHKYYVKH